MNLLPSKECDLCPRLRGFILDNRKTYPGFYNGPVPSFGNLDAEFLIVGLAPGLKGANAIGRPFTGDYAGDILYPALLKSGFAKGSYVSPRGEVVSGAYQDNLTLVNSRITNAVRCVPPENKPETSEIKQCNNFLKNELAAMPNLKVILSLGLVSHNAVLKATGHKAGFAKFTHGLVTQLNPKIKLLNSYHTSRYNINVGTLTIEMFDQIIEKAKELVKS